MRARDVKRGKRVRIRTGEGRVGNKVFTIVSDVPQVRAYGGFAPAGYSTTLEPTFSRKRDWIEPVRGDSAGWVLLQSGGKQFLRPLWLLEVADL